VLKKYKKVTEAFQWDGTAECREHLAKWIGAWCAYTVQYDSTDAIHIDGQEIWPGDYIIRNMKDYPHVIAKADFEATYTLGA
jgi:hypothetical protein